MRATTWQGRTSRATRTGAAPSVEDGWFAAMGRSYKGVNASTYRGRYRM